VNRREFIALLDDDHTLDDFKNRLSRGFGVQIRVDLQVRAEIVIQPEEGRRVFTSNELSDLAEGHPPSGLDLNATYVTLAYSASRLTTLSAIFVKVASVFFSSCNVASRSPTASPRPSSLAQVFKVP
jgi:hypothetical protein